MKKKMLWKRLRKFKNAVIYIVRIWSFFIYYYLVFGRNRHIKYFYEEYKNNKDFYQIIKNDKLVVTRSYFDWAIDLENWYKFVEVPYRFFQRFSDKTQNYIFQRDITFGGNIYKPNEKRIGVSDIAEKVYYEGITFRKVDFSDVDLRNICFHNCIFDSCSFNGVKSSKKLREKEKTLFSACEFIKTEFINCELNSIRFSWCVFNEVIIKHSYFFDCIFDRSRFSYVLYDGVVCFFHTRIYSPYRRFEIIPAHIDSVLDIDDGFLITAQQKYIESTNNIEEIFDSKYKLFEKEDYEKSKNTYKMFEDIYKKKGICIPDDLNTNLYYQKRRAETRSFYDKTKRIKGYLSEWIIGYGEKPFNVLIAIIFLIILFGIAYSFSGYHINDQVYRLHLVDFKLLRFSTIFSVMIRALYFSYIVLITGGIIEAYPIGVVSRILMGGEMFLGIILITLFISVLFRKMTK